MASPRTMVEVEDVAKAFGDLQAVDGVSFLVEEGKIFGVIGPDGAGKTTLFRMLVSLLVPDRGRLRVDGLDPVVDYRELRRRVGYMPGRFSLYSDLSVAENLNFFATIFGTTVEANRELIDDLYRHLEPFAHRRAGALSGGMKQKLALCCALVHKPRVLFLDEPTTGVDAVSRRELWEMLDRLRPAGIAVVVSTPYMDEAERCDRVALMTGGSFLAVAPPQELAAGYDHPLLAVSLPNQHRLPVLRALRSFPHACSAYVFGSTIHYTDRRDRVDPAEIEGYLHEQGLSGIEATPIDADIEDVFMALASGTQRGSETQGISEAREAAG
ncbi:MAG: ABC transporter ATP-binding protein [Acidobacteriota bacterium]|nr:ABC transporter ATP-binding protein [Acidobacteriota bacterium]